MEVDEDYRKYRAKLEIKRNSPVLSDIRAINSVITRLANDMISKGSVHLQRLVNPTSGPQMIPTEKENYV